MKSKKTAWTILSVIVIFVFMLIFLGAPQLILERFEEQEISSDSGSEIELAEQIALEELAVEESVDDKEVVIECTRGFTNCGTSNGRAVCCLGRSDCGQNELGEPACKSSKGKVCGGATYECGANCCFANQECDKEKSICTHILRDCPANRSVCPDKSGALNCCKEGEECTTIRGELTCSRPGGGESRCTANGQIACTIPGGDPFKPSDTSCCNPGISCVIMNNPQGGFIKGCCLPGTSPIPELLPDDPTCYGLGPMCPEDSTDPHDICTAGLKCCKGEIDEAGNIPYSCKTKCPLKADDVIS